LNVPGSERGKLLYKLAELLEKNGDALAAIEALDAGTLHVDIAAE
jgi:aldehyde dehydrogenase (NAD+)